MRMMSSLPVLGAAMTTATNKLKLTRIIDEATTRITEIPRWSDASHDVLLALRCSFLDSWSVDSALPREISLAQFPHYHTPPPSHLLSAMPTRRSPTMQSICHMNTRNKEVREFQAIVETIHANMDRMVKNAERQRLKAIGKRIILEKRRNSNEDALR